MFSCRGVYIAYFAGFGGGCEKPALDASDNIGIIQVTLLLLPIFLQICVIVPTGFSVPAVSGPVPPVLRFLAASVFFPVTPQVVVVYMMYMVGARLPGKLLEVRHRRSWGTAYPPSLVWRYELCEGSVMGRSRSAAISYIFGVFRDGGQDL
jgi:hypothetical protein